MKAACLLIVVAACGSSGSGSGPKTEPVAVGNEAARPAAFQLTLGEATVVDLIDKRLQPVERVRWKLHQDGRTESGNDTGEEWRDEVKVGTDGSLTWDGKAMATISERQITFVAMGDHQQPPIAIDGNTLSLVVWQKERDGEDFTAKIELASDGKVTVHHRDGTRVQWRIEAQDPAVMRTAFVVFGATHMKSVLD